MKKKLILAGVVVAALCLPQFTSCSDDNDDDNEHTDSSKNDSGVSFVDSMTVSGTIGNYSYVDLGLKSGLKWATYNVGATTTTEKGNYYSWDGGVGERKVSSIYDPNIYQIIYLVKYNTDSSYVYDSYGVVDNKTVLEAEDDAATKNWGDSWRMPTKEEQEELIDGCTWQWIENYGGTGVSGQMGTSKSNGNTIFLPAAGFHLSGTTTIHGTGMTYDDDLIKGDGTNGYYWTSSLSEEEPLYAVCCLIGNSGAQFTGVARASYYRSEFTCSVRAVSE